MDPQTLDAIKQHLAQAASQDWKGTLGLISAIATPLVSIVIGLVLYIWRNKVEEIEKKFAGMSSSQNSYTSSCDDKRNKCINKHEAELKAISELINKVEKELVDGDQRVIHNFREIVKEERVFTQDVLVKQSENIRELFQKLNTLCVDTTRLEGRIDGVEKICNMNHKG